MVAADCGTRLKRARTLHRVTKIIVLLDLLVCVALNAGTGDGWGRFIVLPESIATLPEPLVIDLIQGGGKQKLKADGFYRYIKNRGQVLLHGQTVAPNVFSPTVKYEVSEGDKSHWKQLVVNHKEAGSETAILDPQHPEIKVRFDLEPFREFVSSRRYGRLVLENSDAAVIELEDLLPTPNARDVTGNFKADVFGGDLEMRTQGYKQPRLNDPATLADVVSLGGRLFGEFIFDGQTRGATLEGSRTFNGDFWPNVTLSIGNSDQNWKSVRSEKADGKTAKLQIPAGIAEKVRIDLTGYRGLIGKYKVGKVTFSNGQSAVFYIQLLDPRG